MLTNKELQALIELMNKKEETLQRIEEIFLSKFKDSQGVFRASYALANLLNLNLLTSLQRIPAIFLLVQNYKTEGISHHPFGATIFSLVQSTGESFQKMMISDIIIDSRREQYSRMTVETLYQRQQILLQPIEDRVQLKLLKQQFIRNLPEISQQSQSQVKNVVRDFVDKERQIQIPEHNINLGTIKQSEIDEEAFSTGFMRPIPKFIEIESSQFHWFSPSIAADITWDSTSETNKKLSKSKILLKKALEQHLTKDECTEIQKTLESDHTSVLSLQLKTQSLNSLIKQNPFLASAYLTKLSSFPIIDTYLDALLNCEITINSLDVVSKLTKSKKISSDFLAKYTNSVLCKMIQMDQENKDRGKLARVVIGLIKNFKKSKFFQFQLIQEKLLKFLDEYIAVDEVQQFKKLMSKQ